MAERPTESGYKKPILSIIEGGLTEKNPSDITPKDDYEKAMNFMDEMPKLILDKIDKLKTAGANSENIEFREVREEIINEYAEENPAIINIWNKIKPKETFQKSMENIQQKLHERYNADSLTDDEIVALLNSVKKPPSTEDNITNINTPKTKEYLEKKAEIDSLLRVRDAIAPEIDKEVLELFNQVIEEMDSENS